MMPTKGRRPGGACCVGAIVIFIVLLAGLCFFLSPVRLAGSDGGDYPNTQSVTLESLARDESSGPKERIMEILFERRLQGQELNSITGWVNYWPDTKPGDDLPAGSLGPVFCEEGKIAKVDTIGLDSRIGKRLVDLVGDGSKVLVGLASGEDPTGVSDYLSKHPRASSHFSGLVMIVYHYDNPLGAPITLLQFKDGTVVRRQVG